jgi:hypothetical protein
MTREFRIDLTRNGDALAYVALRVSLRFGGASELSVRFDPGDDTALSLVEADAYTARLKHTDPLLASGSGTVIKDAVPAGATYNRAIEAAAGAAPTVRRDRWLACRDRFARFADLAPGETITRTETDTAAELQFVARAMGLPGALTFGLPPVPIARIDYTRDSGYWAPLAEYFAAREPILSVDPTSGFLTVTSSLGLHPAMPRAGRPLTRADWNPASLEVETLEAPTQVRLIWTDFDGSGASPTATRTRTEAQVEEDADGHKTRTWTDFADLYEDPESPATVTRSIVTGQGVARTLDGTPISEETTTYDYRDDYTRLVGALSIVLATVDVPHVGSVYREIERTVETRDWVLDTTAGVERRYFLRRVKRVRSGLVLWTNVTNDLTGEVFRDTATPVREASLNRTVDLSAATAQDYDETRISTWIEHYQRSQGAGQVTVVGTLTDDVRERVVDTWNRIEFGDTGLVPAGRARSEYFGAGGRRAVTVDATRIGYPAGREIVTALLARAGARGVRIRLTLMRPNAQDWRLGYVVQMGSDTPYGLAGLYLCEGVDYTVDEPDTTRPNVVQSLVLRKQW